MCPTLPSLLTLRHPSTVPYFQQTHQSSGICHSCCNVRICAPPMADWHLAASLWGASSLARAGLPAPSRRHYCITTVTTSDSRGLQVLKRGGTAQEQKYASAIAPVWAFRLRPWPCQLHALQDGHANLVRMAWVRLYCGSESAWSIERALEVAEATRSKDCSTVISAKPTQHQLQAAARRPAAHAERCMAPCS